MMIIFLISSRVTGDRDNAEYTLDDDLLGDDFKTNMDGELEQLKDDSQDVSKEIEMVDVNKKTK